MWNHSLSEVLNNLLNHNFRLKKFNEYSYSPYDCFHNCIKIEEEKYQIKLYVNKLPMVFAVKAELNNKIQKIIEMKIKFLPFILYLG